MICTPIIASITKKALREIEKAKDTDLLELRLDFVKDINEKNLERLIRKGKIDKIITNRKKTEGGKFIGTEKKRIGILKKAAELGADFVDIELSVGEKEIKNLKKIVKNTKTKLIISFHNFKKTDKREISLIFEKIKGLHPDIIKIVTFANSINDNLIIFNLIKKAKKENKKIIALCMGEKGQISRILGPIFGAELTFGSLRKGKESAPGQITAEALKHVFRINKLKNKHPKIFGLVGNPTGQSKGILIHNKAFKKLT